VLHGCARSIDRWHPDLEGAKVTASGHQRPACSPALAHGATQPGTVPAVLDAHVVASFALASFLIIIVPGPSVLFVVSRGVALGRRAALATVLGNSSGALVQGLAVSAGLGAVVARSIAVYTVLKLAGAAYLVWLGVQAVRGRRELARRLDAGAAPASLARIVRDGFVVGVTNPKTSIFFMAVLPQFVVRSAGRVSLQMMVLCLVFFAVSLASDSTWGMVAGTVRTWFRGDARRLERLVGAGGLAIVGLGVRVAVTGRGK